MAGAHPTWRQLLHLKTIFEHLAQGRQAIGRDELTSFIHAQLFASEDGAEEPGAQQLGTPTRRVPLSARAFEIISEPDIAAELPVPASDGVGFEDFVHAVAELFNDEGHASIGSPLVRGELRVLARALRRLEGEAMDADSAKSRAEQELVHSEQRFRRTTEELYMTDEEERLARTRLEAEVRELSAANAQLRREGEARAARAAAVEAELDGLMAAAARASRLERELEVQRADHSAAVAAQTAQSQARDAELQVLREKVKRQEGQLVQQGADCDRLYADLEAAVQRQASVEALQCEVARLQQLLARRVDDTPMPSRPASMTPFQGEPLDLAAEMLAAGEARSARSSPSRHSSPARRSVSSSVGSAAAIGRRVRVVVHRETVQRMRHLDGSRTERVAELSRRDLTWFSSRTVRRMRSGPWTPAEDAALRAAVCSHGLDWIAVARACSGRTDASVQARWFVLNGEAPLGAPVPAAAWRHMRREVLTI